LMWRLVGIARSDERLRLAAAKIEVILSDAESFYQANPPQPRSVELRNMALTAYLIIKCALQRKESRGLHYNGDHPGKANENWAKDTVIRPEI
jgi:L-aspartate oxidase